LRLLVETSLTIGRVLMTPSLFVRAQSVRGHIGTPSIVSGWTKTQ